MTTPNWAKGVTRVAVLTGAGISTDSGIPDYRGQNGVWTKNPAAVGAFTLPNIDGLHQRAGMQARKVLELHGNMHQTVCTRCAASIPTKPVLARVLAGEADPACQDCGGILKLEIVLFEQYLDEEVLDRALPRICALLSK